MTSALSVESAQRDLKNLLAQLRLGETVTLVGTGGTPLAVLISLRPTPMPISKLAEWNTRWDAVAEKIGRAWQSNQSALEILTEMRR